MLQKRKFIRTISFWYVFIVWFAIAFSRSIAPVIEGHLTLGFALRVFLTPGLFGIVTLPIVINIANKFYKDRNFNFSAKIQKVILVIAFIGCVFAFTITYLTSNNDLVYVVLISLNILTAGINAAYAIKFLCIHFIVKYIEDVDFNLIESKLKDKISFIVFIALNMLIIFVNGYHVIYKNAFISNEVHTLRDELEHAISGIDKSDLQDIVNSVPKIFDTIIIYNENGEKVYPPAAVDETITHEAAKSISKNTHEHYFMYQKKTYFIEFLKAQHMTLVSGVPLSYIYEKMYQDLAIPVIILVLFCSLFFVLFITAMRLAVSKPLSLFRNRVRDLAGGDADLTKRLNVMSMDEMGDIARLFNVLIGNLQAMIKDVANNAKMVNDSSSGLAQIWETMSNATHNMTGKINGVSSSASEVSDNMNLAAATMEQASKNIHIVAAAAEEMTSTIAEIAKNSSSARETTLRAVNIADAALEKIERLGNVANEIGKITELITDISSQTNLLSLNATIEAARAGEAGKGFAVVANEIKELAKQTANATQQIKKQITDNQNATKDVIVEISQISSVIKNSGDIVSSIAASVEEQSTTTREIAENITEASKGISDVNNNVSLSSKSTESIAQEILDVNRLSNEISESSTHVNKSAEELTVFAEQLLTIVKRFKL